MLECHRGELTIVACAHVHCCKKTSNLFKKTPFLTFLPKNKKPLTTSFCNYVVLGGQRKYLNCTACNCGFIPHDNMISLIQPCASALAPSYDKYSLGTCFLGKLSTFIFLDRELSLNPEL